MSGPAPDAITISIRLRDEALAERVADALAALVGVRLVDAEADADLILAPPEPDGRARDPALTAREREVIALLSEGLSNKRIGQRLGISPDTAKFHVGRLLEKLDATGQTDAVAQAARLRVIEL